MQAVDLVVGFSSRFRTALGALILLTSVHCGAANAQGTEPVWPTAQWQTSTPEQQGMDSAALAKLVAAGTTRSFDSLLVTRHGRIVLDAYYAPFTVDMPHAINSSTKAVVATLLAIAYKDGLLDRLDHPMLDFFSDRSIANVDERKKAITVQHLLNMTSGLEWDEGFVGGRQQSLSDMGRSPDWVQFILDRPMAHAPGEELYYNSGGSHLLSAIVSKLAGKNTADYAQERLFGPLGIAQPFWRRDPQRLPIGGYGLMMRPQDMAKIGYLYLRNGEWAGKQLLPADFLDAVNHVVGGCSEITGNLSGEAPVKLRLVSDDEINDLALLQAPSPFKDVASIRQNAIQVGNGVVAIGYPYHGLLTSDFTVTTGIVSSLSGILNDTRHLQISAAVQPGNSGGPLFDLGGAVVGVVAAKLNAVRMARATGSIPENINFAIKTGALRDFLDNSAVSYRTAEWHDASKRETSEIAKDARGYTLLITCTVNEQSASKRGDVK